MIGTAEVGFRESDHTYWRNGMSIPGVTSVIRQQLRGPFPASKEVMAAKAELGQLVHDATAMDAAGELDEDSVDAELLPYLGQWRKFMREVRPEIVGTEELVYHSVYNYAGRLDHRMLINGEHTVVDKKIGVMDINHEVQVCAYTEAYKDGLASNRWPTKRALLHIWPTGYRLVPIKFNSFHVFLAALTAFVWRMKND